MGGSDSAKRYESFESLATISAKKITVVNSQNNCCEFAKYSIYVLMLCENY